MRVGIDGRVGLVPVVGDAASAGLSLYLVAEARRCGLPAGALLPMRANVFRDTVVGAVPVVGERLGFGFKANRRNGEPLCQRLRALPADP